MLRSLLCPILALALLSSCSDSGEIDMINVDSESQTMEAKVNQYANFKLTSNTSSLSDNEKKMIPLLIEAAAEMDGLFWQQAFGDKNMLLQNLADPDQRRFAEINYGPWDRLDNNKPFVEGVGEKPLGANLYPHDISKDEFEKAIEGDEAKASAFKSLYTLIRRDINEELISVPYHEAFRPSLERASAKLIEAAEYADDPGLKNYLLLRADALVTDNYQPSDLAWMDMKNNGIDIVIGAIENYEDQLYGSKAAFEAYVLVKDKEWSAKLQKYAAMLPELQRGLPVPDQYKAEKPGTDSDLNAYDVVYYAGDCNAGSKTIAINLPNDEEVQLQKGTRRLQLKNAMRAKFDKILVPIAGELIAEDQVKNVSFDAFFGNTMFHEVAHGLGIKNTLDGSGKTVRAALEELASALEEGKADILGLYMVTKLHEMGELGDADLMDNYVTFMAGIFRSVRFGGSSSHGKANLIRFNYFKEMDAFTRDDDTGTYRVDFEKMQVAMNSLSEKILTLQGNGDKAGVAQLVSGYAVVGEQLQKDLDLLQTKNIPVDIVFDQGIETLGSL